MSACRAKHTKYQPAMPDEWKCPKCGVGTEFRQDGRTWDGWIIQDSDDNSADDCNLNHDADTIGCGKCGYGCTGATFARKLQQAHNLVDCPHCKGKGLVKREGV